MTHSCPYCHASISDTALCVGHAGDLRALLDDYAVLTSGPLIDRMAGLTRRPSSESAGQAGSPETRDAARADLIDVKAETDETIMAWARHYAGTPPAAPARWLHEYAERIITTRQSAAVMLDELADALDRIVRAINPPDSPAGSTRTCPLCGGRTRADTTDLARRICLDCRETIAPEQVPVILRLRAPSLWLSTRVLSDYLEIVTGQTKTPGAIRHRALRKGVRRDERGRWSAADYLATLDTPPA